MKRVFGLVVFCVLVSSSNCWAFWFYGLKSGMTRAEVEAYMVNEKSVYTEQREKLAKDHRLKPTLYDHFVFRYTDKDFSNSKIQMRLED